MSFFGKNIRKLRQLKSYSQQDIADIIGVKRGALGAYEEGRSEPKIHTIIKTANYFSIPIDELLTKELTVNEIFNFNSKLTVDESLYRKAFPKIPLITKDNLQDYFHYHTKSDFINNMPFIQLPLSTGETYRAFSILDLEMSYKEKGLFPRDIVVGIPLELKNLQTQKLCIVVATSIKVRHVISTKHNIQLKASHPAIEDELLQPKDISEIWEVVGTFEFLREM